MSTRSIALVLAGLIGVSSQIAQAQYGPSYGNRGSRSFNYSINRRPTISPYLNLFQGPSAANNYYNLVRPQMGQIRTNRQFNSDVTVLDRQVLMMEQGATGQNTIPSTGHTTHFGNHMHYYGNHPASGGYVGATRGAAGLRGRPAFSPGVGLSGGASTSTLMRAGGGSPATRQNMNARGSGT